MPRATHGILSGPALERIENSCIKELAFLNTIPAPENAPKKIRSSTLRPSLPTPSRESTKRRPCPFCSDMFFRPTLPRPGSLQVSATPVGEYEKTRHNTGFRARCAFKALRRARQQAEVSGRSRRLRVGRASARFCQAPDLYECVRFVRGAVRTFYKIPPERIIVIF